MKFQIIGFTIGVLLIILGIAEMIPAIMDWGEAHSNARAFFTSSAFSLFFGGALVLTNISYEPVVTIREGFLLTTLSWVLMSFFASIPLYFSDLDISLIDAFFETVSGITTTGSTVLSGLDQMSHGILLWRSVVQWIGGIGIIGFAIVFLPFLRIGGMQLFRTESSDASEKIMPKTAHVTTSILVVYVLLTSIFGLTYKLLGMSWFDAVNHAMTTIATAGYSTHDASFGHFNSYALDMAGTLFMIMSGLPFLLYVRLIYQGRFDFFRDDQFRAFIGIMTAFIAILTMWLWHNSNYSLADSFRYAAFNIASVVSTCGYATTDYLQWGPFASVFFLFATYLGACAGSTSGGLKTMRLVICFKDLEKQLRKLIYPHGVFTVRYQGEPLKDNVVASVFGFFALYVLANVFFTITLAATGLDLDTSMSAVATAFSNTGPGIGGIIGPAGNFSSLSDAAKMILCLCMILGRLEIVTVLILFTRGFWRR